MSLKTVFNMCDLLMIFRFNRVTNIWTDTRTGQYTEDKVYVVQTNTKVIERCILMTTDPGDLVLDPTCGSGTTAYVAEQWGRRWITIDTSPRGDCPGAHAADGRALPLLPAGRFAGRRAQRSRIKRTSSAAHTAAADRRAMSKKGSSTSACRTSRSSRLPTTKRSTPSTRNGRSSLEPLRLSINQAAGKDWQEWEVPREAPKDLPGFENLTGLLAEWWKLRARATEGDRRLHRPAGRYRAALRPAL